MKVLSECQICQLSTSDKLHSTVPSTPVRLTPVCQNYKDTANLWNTAPNADHLYFDNPFISQRKPQLLHLLSSCYFCERTEFYSSFKNYSFHIMLDCKRQELIRARAVTKLLGTIKNRITFAGLATGQNWTYCKIYYKEYELKSNRESKLILFIQK